MHDLLLCETFMNRLKINATDIPGYDKYVNFRQMTYRLILKISNKWNLWVYGLTLN